MAYGIFIIAAGRFGDAVDQWLEDYSGPENDRGYRNLAMTTDPAKAKRFTSRMEAIQFWQQDSVTHPIRLHDGKRNRPLTGYTVSFDELPDRA